ncbi:MAG: response regulator [Planctomycetes bacterium]|nr:response regulator [Planctomycetota bacterium]
MKRVIIIDDDSFFAELVSIIVQKMGFFAVICFRFEGALEIVEKTDPSFIITDIFMPGMGGIEGIKHLRIKFPETKIIAMSGGWATMSPEDTVHAATKSGADAGLKKPFSADDLTAVLQSLDIDTES